MKHPEHEFDDTDMTPQEFEQRMNAAVPTEISTSRPEYQAAWSGWSSGAQGKTTLFGYVEFQRSSYNDAFIQTRVLVNQS